ncbi:MAG: hypothetical protein PF508_15545 [Spirochaeta sp.]|jgi:hypothetical protein|nr:hypothetical protein [Spirochaeta sp.]
MSKILNTAGWRFRNGELAATPDAALEFESRDGRITGAIEIVPTEYDAAIVARTLLLTELHKRSGIRIGYSQDQPLLFVAVHELDPEISVVTILYELDGTILSLGARVRAFQQRDLQVLSAIARRSRPVETGALQRSTAGGRRSCSYLLPP